MNPKQVVFCLSLMIIGWLSGCVPPAPVEAFFGATATPTVLAELQTVPDLILPDPLVVGETGLALSPEWEVGVTAVNYLFTWYGDGLPAYEYEQIVAENGRFMHGSGRDITRQVTQLLASLTGLEPVDKVQPVNLWTDDYPEWTVEVMGADGRSLLIYSESTGLRGHAPWYVQAGDQLYRQTSGDIGFALHDLVSEEVQDYFTLEGRPFDETYLDIDGRSTLYRGADKITGLLPVARSLEYTFSPSSNRLSGTFIIESGEAYEISSQAITMATQMRIILPDGPDQLCVPNVAEALSPDTTRWFFDCSLLSNAVLEVVPVEISFGTRTETILTSTGSLRLRDR